MRGHFALPRTSWIDLSLEKRALLMPTVVFGKVSASTLKMMPTVILLVLKGTPRFVNSPGISSAKMWDSKGIVKTGVAIFPQFNLNFEFEAGKYLFVPKKKTPFFMSAPRDPLRRGKTPAVTPFLIAGRYGGI